LINTLEMSMKLTSKYYEEDSQLSLLHPVYANQ